MLFIYGKFGLDSRQVPRHLRRVVMNDRLFVVQIEPEGES